MVFRARAVLHTSERETAWDAFPYHSALNRAESHAAVRMITVVLLNHVRMRARAIMWIESKEGARMVPWDWESTTADTDGRLWHAESGKMRI